LGYIERAKQITESLSIFGEVDGIRRRPNDRNSGMLQVQRKIQRRLSAELYDYPTRPFFPDDMKDIFERERLEVKTIGSVVICRHGLRITVDHDRLEPFFLQSKGGVATTVIEFDPLPDSVRPASKNDDFLLRAWFSFVLLLVRRVKVRRIRLKFRSAR